MSVRNKLMHILSVLVFSTGILLGMVLLGSTVWKELEAFLFAPSIGADERFTTLSCPLMMTTTESGTITARIKNPTDRTIQPLLRTQISQGLVTLKREFDERPAIPAGETQEFHWTVTAEDAVWDRFILVRVYQFRHFPLPSRTGTCGILVVNLPDVSGSQIIAAVLAASLLSMVAGGGLWVRGSRPLKGQSLYATRAMAALAGSVLAGILASFLGWWLVGGLLFLFAVLLAVVIISYFLLAS